jgi:hypothetical protein
LIDAGISLEGASDHGVSEALYLRDPDQNGIELSWDRPKAGWPHSLLGRLFGYGDVTIHGTGNAYDPLRAVDRPIALRNEIIAR